MEFLHLFGLCHDSFAHFDVLDLIATYDPMMWHFLKIKKKTLYVLCFVLLFFTLFSGCSTKEHKYVKQKCKHVQDSFVPAGADTINFTTLK